VATSREAFDKKSIEDLKTKIEAEIKKHYKNWSRSPDIEAIVASVTIREKLKKKRDDLNIILNEPKFHTPLPEESIQLIKEAESLLAESVKQSAEQSPPANPQDAGLMGEIIAELEAHLPEEKDFLDAWKKELPTQSEDKTNNPQKAPAETLEQAMSKITIVQKAAIRELITEIPKQVKHSNYTGLTTSALKAVLEKQEALTIKQLRLKELLAAIEHGDLSAKSTASAIESAKSIEATIGSARTLLAEFLRQVPRQEPISHTQPSHTSTKTQFMAHIEKTKKSAVKKVGKATTLMFKGAQKTTKKIREYTSRRKPKK